MKIIQAPSRAGGGGRPGHGDPELDRTVSNRWPDSARDGVVCRAYGCAVARPFQRPSGRACVANAEAEVAFAALGALQGLGPRRLPAGPSDPGDVEDAFQATFLVLVRRSHSVHVQDSLGRWLYGVARRVAARARKAARPRMALAIPPPDDLAARPGDPPSVGALDRPRRGTGDCRRNTGCRW